MAGALPDIQTRVRVDTSELSGAVGRASRAGSFLGSAFGNIAAQGISAGLSSITNFVGASVDAFAQLEDASAAAGVVFGKGMGEVTRFADTAAAKFGISKSAAIDAANTFGTFGKSAGLGGRELGKFSTGLAGLAGDMASFRGTSPEQAIQAIGAALRGETEPIRQYGVLLDDASMRNQALKMGLISTTKDALTPQQKVLAAQALIYQQTSMAQGDFARTSDSTANTQKRLAAETANVQARIGEQLAPAITAARQAFLGILQTVSNAVLPAMERIGQVIGAEVGPMLRQMADWAQQNLLPALQRLGAFIMGTIVPALGGILRSALEGARAAFASISEAVERNRPQLEQLGRIAMDVGRILATHVAPIVGGVLKIAFQLLGNIIGTTIDVIGKMVPVIQSVLRVAIPAFAGLAEAALDMAGFILGAAAKAFGWVPGIGPKLKAADAAFDKFRETATASLRGIAADAKNIGRDAGTGLALGLENATPAVRASANRIAAVAAQTMRAELQERSPSKVFAEIGRYAGLGFVQGLVGTESEVTTTIERFGDRVRDGMGKLKTNVDETIAGILSANKGKLLTLAQEAEQTRTAFASIATATSGVDLTQIGKTDSGVTAATLTEGLQGAVNVASQFAADIAALTKMGLSDAAIADLTQRGAAAAGATARAIVEGGQQTVDAVNAHQARLQQLGVQVAKVGSDAFYDAGRATAAGLAAGFASQQSAIDAQMLAIAKRMQKQIKKALGIKSPSSVFAGIGDEVPAGMALGIARSSGLVSSAVRSMGAQSLAGIGGGPRLAAAGSSRTWSPSVTVQGVFSDPRDAARAAADELTWQARLQGAPV